MQKPLIPEDENSSLARTAIVYDFDGTLAQGNIQEHSFISELGVEASHFWAEVKEAARHHDADEVLMYMWRMLDHARMRGTPITRDFLHRHGQQTPLFLGLDTWFTRLNEYTRERGLALEHYVVSSGVLEMIEASPIFESFRKVYASKYLYNEMGEAVWPAVAINYTTKTQFLFRINKGVANSWDNERVNRWQPMEERPIPFSRMIFIGDGDTDIPSMKMIRHQGGQAIAVFDPDRWNPELSQKSIYRLIAEDRVHYVAAADYRVGSQLEVIVKGILGRFARENGFRA
ncbi:MAG: HAD family hydrolase [Acidobacteriota bacterium]